MTTKKNLKQNLDEVIKSIATDIKAILKRLDTVDEKLTRKAPNFNPKHWKKVPSNRMIEIEKDLFINAFEMHKVQFVPYRTNATVYVEPYSGFRFNMSDFVEFYDGFVPDESWQINGANTETRISDNILQGIIDKDTRLLISHPDVQATINLTIKAVNRDGTGVYEWIESLHEDYGCLVGDISHITGDNKYLDKIVITFSDARMAQLFSNQLLFEQHPNYQITNKIKDNVVTFTDETVILNEVFIDDIRIDDIVKVEVWQNNEYFYKEF